jgi:DNA-binding beta-propeller fold protein YncE/mono/diheme cytochrome c family protein
MKNFQLDIVLKKCAPLLAVVAVGCGDENHALQSRMTSKPQSNVAETKRFGQSRKAGESVKAELSWSVDLDGLPNSKTLEPLLVDKGVNLSGSNLSAKVFIKKATGRKNAAQVEVFVYNEMQDSGVRNLKASIASSNSKVFDMSINPYNETELKGDVTLGALAPEGVVRFVFALEGFDISNLRIGLSGETGLVSAQHTSAVRVAPDGKTVWAVNHDLGVLSVSDTATDKLLQKLALGGSPRSLAFSADQRFVYVALAQKNEIVVIDAAKVEIISKVTEAQGLDREGRSLLVSPFDGSVYVTSLVQGTLQKLVPNAEGLLSVVGTLEVGHMPTALALSADGSTLLVPHKLPRGPIVSNESWVSVVDTSTFKLKDEAIIEDHFNLSGKDSDAACLAKAYSFFPLGTQKPEDMTLEGAASQLSGVFMPPSGGSAWVPGTRITGAVVVLERGPKADPNLKRFGGLQPGQYVAPIMFMFNSSQPGKFEKLVGPSREIPTLPSVTDCYKHSLELEFINAEILRGKKEQTNPFLAYAIGNAGLTDLGMVQHISFSQGGRRALLLSDTSSEIAVYDAASIHPSAQKHFALSGNNPLAMDLTPDGKKAYVVYDNSPYLSVLDTSSMAAEKVADLPGPSYVPYRYTITLKTPIQLGTSVSPPLLRDISQVPERPDLKEIGQIQLNVQDPLDTEMRMGRMLFQSANPEKLKVSMNRLGACASCHPDGGNDGSSWATMEGERRTLSLRGGVAGRGWLHASGTHSSALEFVQTVVPERLGGQISEAETNAMAKYLAYGIPALQSPKVNNEMMLRGKALFEAKCTSCHAGAKYTSGNPDASAPYQGATKDPGVFDIGTKSTNMHVAAGIWTSKILKLGFDKGSAQILDGIRGDRDLGEGDAIQKLLDFRQRPARKAGQLKAPSLVNVSANSIFFHDGTVSTLKGAVERINTLLSFELKDNEIDDVTEFLKTL